MSFVKQSGFGRKASNLSLDNGTGFGVEPVLGNATRDAAVFVSLSSHGYTLLKRGASDAHFLIALQLPTKQPGVASAP
jgi:hypothetical protein